MSDIDMEFGFDELTGWKEGCGMTEGRTRMEENRLRAIGVGTIITSNGPSTSQIAIYIENLMFP